MTDPVTLTLVRYLPRNLADRRGRREARGMAVASVCLPAGFHAALAALGRTGWTADAVAWLLLAALAAGAVPVTHERIQRVAALHPHDGVALGLGWLRQKSAQRAIFRLCYCCDRCTHTL